MKNWKIKNKIKKMKNWKIKNKIKKIKNWEIERFKVWTLFYIKSFKKKFFFIKNLLLSQTLIYFFCFNSYIF